MTDVEVLDGLIQREGGFVVNPDDRGGPTKYGITAATLGNWRGLSRPASREEVWNLTQDEARALYTAKYIHQPGFTPEHIPFEPLRVQLIDFGVNSGPERAIRWLQRCMGEWMPVTGALDSHTKAELAYMARQDVRFLRFLNDALVAARLYMIDSWTDADPSQKVFEEGVESRALRFFLSKP